MTEMIPLPEAAKRLEMSWERAWRAMLNGDLEGEKRNGRWYVTLSSVREHTESTRTARRQPELPEPEHEASPRIGLPEAGEELQ